MKGGRIRREGKDEEQKETAEVEDIRDWSGQAREGKNRENK